MTKEDVSKVKKMMLSKTTKQVAEAFGVTREAVTMFCKRNDIKTKFKRGQGPSKNGLEVCEFVKNHGIEKAAKKFKKSVNNIKQTCANWKHKIGFDFNGEY